jgi:hypothetical protein
MLSIKKIKFVIKTVAQWAARLRNFHLQNCYMFKKEITQILYKPSQTIKQIYFPTHFRTLVLLWYKKQGKSPEENPTNYLTINSSSNAATQKSKQQ